MLFPDTIQKSAWHYRMVRRANKWLDMKHDVMDDVTALYYWVVLVPLSVLVMLIATVLALAFAIGVVAMGCYGIVAAVHDPRGAAVNVLLLAVFVAVLFLAAFWVGHLIDILMEKSQERLTKLKIQ